jgi:hypothetical protein
MTTAKRQSSLKKVTSIEDGFLFVFAKKNHSIMMFTGKSKWIKQTYRQIFSFVAEKSRVYRKLL